jgi:lysophospholipase L1-like esterase
MESLSWFQLLLAATYSGAFHPTAEGHAAMADAVVEKARAVLAKYEKATAVASD